jgi:hypothetical protein
MNQVAGRGQRSVVIPHHVLPDVEDHLRGIEQDAEAWLFPGENGFPVSTRTVDRIWSKARDAIGRPDLHFHDLRHSGLTWAATTGASLAELMRRAGHESPAAALRYQHATADRDRALADALASMATGVGIVPLRLTETVTAERRPKLPESDGEVATITPLTSEDTEQSQRGSNPCLHLERAIRPVHRVRLGCFSPDQKRRPSISSAFIVPEYVEFRSKTSSKRGSLSTWPDKDHRWLQWGQ